MSALDRDLMLVALWVVIAMTFACLFGFVLARKIYGKTTLTAPSGKGWEVLTEEAQAQALACLAQTDKAIAVMRQYQEVIQRLQLENARLQAELTEKDIPHNETDSPHAGR